MVIEQDRQDVANEAILQDDSFSQAVDSEFLADLQKSEIEFDGWLEKIRERREKSVSLLEEVRGELERSRNSFSPK